MKLWNDTDAELLSYQPDKGKHTWMHGALRIHATDGIKFILGSGLSEADRRNLQPVGSIITFRYRELPPGGRLRFASFNRVREI